VAFSFCEVFVTKEEILAAIKECAERLGHTPSLPELKRCTRISKRSIRRHYVSYKQALSDCGLEKRTGGHQVTLEDLFKDWAEQVRKLGKVPSMSEYGVHSKYSVGPLLTRYRTWVRVPDGLLQYAQDEELESEWKDVLNVIRSRYRDDGGPVHRSVPQNGTLMKAKILTDRPMYGPPLLTGPLAHGPINEAGVVYLFGMLAARLGYVVTRIQTEFPDCEAMRQVEADRWQRVRIEFEFESKNFLKHLHSAKDCDVIVCWVHNWPECPLEIVELSAVIGKFAADGSWKPSAART
jgi:hypothetical protein